MVRSLSCVNERMVLSLKDLIFSFFRERFGDMVIEAKYLPMFHERWIKVIVKKKCPEMEELACELEKEMDELGLHVVLFVKKQRWAVNGLFKRIGMML